MDDAVIGFRVKTGWAAVALVAGTSTSPVVVDLSRVELSDPAVPDSRFPFHAGLDQPRDEGRKKVARLVKVVREFSKRSLENLFVGITKKGIRLRGVGVVVGSLVEPATIRNDHFRAHAEEGRLFRTQIVDAAKQQGLKTAMFLEKALYDHASSALRRSIAQLKKELGALGRQVDGSWRAVEKQATLAAWAFQG